ncbi:MAG: hypothetical protein D6729_00770 [Deltaproteobacteria bacterium]|nr:MAG: hypothetical protein D6729_00770 [Deltaproteobacteria bacterium]
MLALFLSSERPGAALGALPAGSDKVLHFLAYGILAALWMRALWPVALGTAAGGALAAVCVAVAFGALDEWHQSFVPARSADVLDLVADAAGAAAGAFAWWLLRRSEVARQGGAC